MKIYMKKFPLLLSLIGGVFLISCADKGFSQGEYYSSLGVKSEVSSTNKTIFDRMTALEKRNDALQKELRATTTRLSSMWNRLDDLEQNIRGIAGDLDTSISRQEESFMSLQERVAKLEGELEILKTTLQSIDKGRSSTPITESEQKGTADELYKAGLKLFQERKYSTAVVKFSALIKQYPRASLVDNAYFWLGESYYQMQDYKNAVLQYEKVIREYPKSNKIAAAYLKQGLSFIRLNNVQVGRIRLNDVIDKFPKSQEATRAREELKKIAKKK